MPVNRNSKSWWLLVPLGLLLSVTTAVWLRTATSAPVALDFSTLTDMHGRPGNDADFVGRYLLVAFGYTSCPDVCPLTLAAIHRALQNLGTASSELAPVFITVDPQRDTPDRLAVYLNPFDPRIVGFTGSAGAIAASAAAFHVEFQAQQIQGTYSVDHTALLFLVDPRRHIASEIPENLPSRDLAQRIIQAFNEARSATR